MTAPAASVTVPLIVAVVSCGHDTRGAKAAAHMMHTIARVVVDSNRRFISPPPHGFSQADGSLSRWQNAHNAPVKNLDCQEWDNNDPSTAEMFRSSRGRKRITTVLNSNCISPERIESQALFCH